MSSPIGDKPNFVVHSFPFYIADWRDSETRMRLSAEARGVYWELLPYCYREGSLPTERDALIKIAAVTPKEFDRCWPLIKICFMEREGRLFHKKVNIVLADLERYHEQKSDAGRKSVEARRERKRNERLNAAATDVQAAVQTEHIGVFKPSLPLPLPLPLPQPAGVSVPELDIGPPGEFDVDHGFSALWANYPRKGQINRGAAQAAYLALMHATLPENRQALWDRMNAPLLAGGAWAESDDWARGVVCGLAKYIDQGKWDEQPEPRKAKSNPHKPTLSDQIAEVRRRQAQ